MKTAYISLGSNLGDRYNFFVRATKLIQETIGQITVSSTIYETPSWGYNSSKYLNACIGVKASITAEKILQALLAIEVKMGRIRENDIGYKDRTIDLDLLIYENEIINSLKLILPHPKIELRQFILKPLAEIAGEKNHPVLKKTIFELLENCSDKSLLIKYKKNFPVTIFKKFIAIEGNIGAGKTSLAKKISETFQYDCFLENYLDNTYIEKFYKNRTLFALDVENEFLKIRINNFKKFFLKKNNSKNIISDFTIYKSLIFAKQNLNFNDYKNFEITFKKEIECFKPPDIIFYLDQKTKNLLKNIKKRERDFEIGINKDYLKKIENGYLDFMNDNKFINIIKIDVSSLNFVKNTKDYESIISHISTF